MGNCKQQLEAGCQPAAIGTWNRHPAGLDVVCVLGAHTYPLEPVLAFSFTWSTMMGLIWAHESVPVLVALAARPLPCPALTLSFACLALLASRPPSVHLMFAFTWLLVLKLCNGNVHWTQVLAPCWVSRFKFNVSYFWWLFVEALCLTKGGNTVLFTRFVERAVQLGWTRGEAGACSWIVVCGCGAIHTFGTQLLANWVGLTLTLPSFALHKKTGQNVWSIRTTECLGLYPHRATIFHYYYSIITNYGYY